MLTLGRSLNQTWSPCGAFTEPIELLPGLHTIDHLEHQVRNRGGREQLQVTSRLYGSTAAAGQQQGQVIDVMDDTLA